MDNAEHIEVAIRAAKIAQSVLELLETKNITCARLRLAETARQLNALNALLAKIEARANAPLERLARSDNTLGGVVGNSESKGER